MSWGRCCTVLSKMLAPTVNTDHLLNDGALQTKP